MADLTALKRAQEIRPELLRDAQREADRRVLALVAEAREAGATVEACMEALGVTRQAFYAMERRVRNA